MKAITTMTASVILFLPLKLEKDILSLTILAIITRFEQE
jgi:hypothetical protein